MQRLVGMIVLMLGLFGCGATGQVYSAPPAPPSDQGSIVVYRPWGFVGAGCRPEIWVDGKKALTLKNGGYTVLNVAPGQHRVEIPKPRSFLQDDYSASIDVTVEAGNVHYVRWVPEITSMQPAFFYVGFGTNLALVTKELSDKEITNCKYIPPFTE